MRILLVASLLPWPETTGARQRVANVARGLAGAGKVDLFALSDPRRLDPPGPTPPDLPFARVGVVTGPAILPHRLRRGQAYLRGDLPAAVAVMDYEPARAAFAGWATLAYDLVWFSRLQTYLGLRPERRPGTIIDLDDLEDWKLSWSRRIRTGMGEDSGLRTLRWLREVRTGQERRRWRAWQRRAAAMVDTLVVCSDLDRRRLGVPDARVIPNGYTLRGTPVGREKPGRPPVVTFVGMLTYRPNVDAAMSLARRIAPLLRRHIPSVQVRLVGRTDQRVRALDDPPRVVVTGPVTDVATELARADVIAVPLRQASGTRIKILEAFAHQIPVVSTSVGLEGLDAEDGVHLLVRDSDDALAAGCLRLLTDAGLRAYLVETAHRLFLERYQWSSIHPHIAALARAVAAREAVLT